ncbi:copper chaperone PCu(A)C [Streptomyces sp. NPDC059862]|uniref:copper chaperone PCu(A)C n=1 Tax=Streptomyces sp. NPDC059862 TaxID=3346975 RepID=UPI0036504AD1
MSGASWRPTRRRLADTLRAAVAPVAACGIALGALTAWTAAGNAGSGPRIEVSGGRVFLPNSESGDTAAFFRITNSGGMGDRLTKVTSSDTLGEEGTLSRHNMTGDAAATGKAVDSVIIPAGERLDMSPYGLDITVRAKADWRTGDLVRFTLHFEDSGRIETQAVVVLPTSDGW